VGRNLLRFAEPPSAVRTLGGVEKAVSEGRPYPISRLHAKRSMSNLASR
jgi:hypothetical protein